MINSIEEYLSRLREELSGCDTNIIQNALADSEEHLRMALESDPDLQSVIEKYGLPEEVALNYKELGGNIPSSTETIPAHDTSNSPGVFSRLGSAFASLGKWTISNIWVIAGVLLVLVSLGFMLAGGAMLWADSALTDDDGYIMSDTLNINRSSYAIASEPAEVEMGWAWALDEGNLAKFKIEVESENPTKNIFIGVAREDDLANYLEDVPHDRIVDLEIENAKFHYETIPGIAQPASPTTQTFWAQSVHGNGSQVLEWEPETGTWVFVIMNEDGSAGIDANVEIGAKVPWLFGVGIGLLIGGVVGLVIGILIIVFAMRRRGRNGSALPDSQPLK